MRKPRAPCAAAMLTNSAIVVTSGCGRMNRDAIAIHDDRARELVVKRLLAGIERDPEEPEEERQYRDEIREVANQQLPHRRCTAGSGVCDDRADHHLSRRRRSIPPEHERRGHWADPRNEEVDGS